MKYLWILFIMAIGFTSCEKYETSDIQMTKGKFLEKDYTPAKTEYKYHYGYSIMRGKFCYHYGPTDTPARFDNLFTFKNDTLDWDDFNLYNHANVGDSLIIRYVDRYEVYKNHRKYLGSIIKFITTRDTMLKY